MMFEFKSAYPKIQSGGIILSDNASMINDAFKDSAIMVKPASYKIINDFGVIIK